LSYAPGFGKPVPLFYTGVSPSHNYFAAASTLVPMSGETTPVSQFL